MEAKGPLHGPHFQQCKREDAPFLCFCFLTNPTLRDVLYAHIGPNLTIRNRPDYGLRS